MNKSDFTRRSFIKTVAFSSAAMCAPAPGLLSKAFAQLPGGTLDPASIPKYVTPLVIPPAMPRTSRARQKRTKNIDYYEIAVMQFQQQVLPPGLPATPVWSYGSINHPGSFHFPSFTIEAKHEQPVRVKWINGLIDGNGGYLPHLLPVDQTLLWANPGGGLNGRDSHGHDPNPYSGPVPIVTHLHGAHTTQESDGFAEAWYLPNANNIDPNFAKSGSYYDLFKAEFAQKWGVDWEGGSAVFQYPNDQPASALWFHDHTVGMTRLNVYAGPAGFYLLRGGPSDLISGVLPGPAPALGDPVGAKYYEIPLAIQDRSFYANGSLFYPNSREFFDGFGGPYAPESDIAPIWNPEFFGNCMLVNGHTWPVQTVEPRRYRLRMLNGCNGRFLILKLVTHPLATRPASPVLPFWQIGAEGGFLPVPVMLPQLLMAPAERADVIVDFTGVPAGTEFYLINEGPDEPFGGGITESDFPAADPHSTGQVMKFVVGPRVPGSRDTSIDPAVLALPAASRLGPHQNVRQLALLENDSVVLPDVGPKQALLGILSGGTPEPRTWHDPITERPALGSTEIWEIHNFTADAHPIHVHLVQFELVDRSGEEGTRAPEPWETGPKDTVISYPGEITRIKAKFDTQGLFPWHCHIVEHEDHEMMRPFLVT